MGRQIQFFMSAEDESEFIEVVRESGDRVLRERLQNGSPEDVTDSPSLPGDYQFYLASRQSKIVESKNGFIDPYDSDVIEFSRSRTLKGNAMDPGRLWVEMRYWDRENRLIVKEDWLLKRYEFYRRWIQKHYRKSKTGPFYLYIGEGAYRLYLSGVKMMISPIRAEEF